MNTRALLAPVVTTIASSAPIRAVTSLGISDVLGWVGLARSRNRFLTQSALVAAGALIGASAVLLFTPESGRDMRSRFGKRTGRRIGEQVGKAVGGQIGAHPVQTAKVVDKAQDIFSTKHS